MSDDQADLATRSCTPCKGGEPPLGPEEAEAFRARTPEWSLQDDARRIERSFRFKDFRQAFAFVERVAMLGEEEGHHPDISFGWGRALISLQTKKIKGLHANDFVMAAKIDQIAAAGPIMPA